MHAGMPNKAALFVYHEYVDVFLSAGFPPVHVLSPRRDLLLCIQRAHVKFGKFAGFSSFLT